MAASKQMQGFTRELSRVASSIGSTTRNFEFRSRDCAALKRTCGELRRAVDRETMHLEARKREQNKLFESIVTLQGRSEQLRHETIVLCKVIASLRHEVDTIGTTHARVRREHHQVNSEVALEEETCREIEEIATTASHELILKQRERNHLRAEVARSTRLVQQLRAMVEDVVYTNAAFLRTVGTVVEGTTRVDASLN